MIAFFLGATVAMITVLLFIALVPEERDSGDRRKHLDELSSGIQVYYFTLVICFIIGATGVAVQVFRAYGVNYAFIFEIDQHYRLIHH